MAASAQLYNLSSLFFHFGIFRLPVIPCWEFLGSISFQSRKLRIFVAAEIFLVLMEVYEFDLASAMYPKNTPKRFTQAC